MRTAAADCIVLRTLFPTAQACLDACSVCAPYERLCAVFVYVCVRVCVCVCVRVCLCVCVRARSRMCVIVLACAHLLYRHP